MTQVADNEKTTFNIETYLARVGLSVVPQVDEEGLHMLHKAQFFTIPFENLDIQLGRGIKIDAASIVDKVVNHPRGGYCFELNGLMLMALQACGFKARPLLGRVHLSTPPSGRTHQISYVELGKHLWIMDVGFGGGGPRIPMLLEEGWCVTGENWGFRLERREPWGWLLQSLVNSEWLDSYSFDLSYVAPSDIVVGNHYTSTSPNTHFTQARVVSLPKPAGRITIWNFTLTEIKNGNKTTQEIIPGQPYLDILQDRFGLSLDAAYTDLKQPAEQCH